MSISQFVDGEWVTLTSEEHLAQCLAQLREAGIANPCPDCFTPRTDGMCKPCGIQAVFNADPDYREWSDAQARLDFGGWAPDSDRPYTIADALDDKATVVRLEAKFARAERDAKTDPGGCAMCGRSERIHGQRWRTSCGAGPYVAPSNAQRLDRMYARRAARLGLPVWSRPKGRPAVNPINRSDRVLLARVHRWAREHGWRIDWTYRWVDGTVPNVNVKWGDGEIGIARAIDRVAHDGRAVWSNTTWIPVASVTQAVDVLVALDILPAWLSSSWAEAEDRYRDALETATVELQRAQGAYRDVVAGWAERAGLPAVGARIDPEDPPQWAIDRRHAGTGVPDDAPDAPPEWVVALLPDVDWVGGERQ